jgi:hypothetical protein
MPLTRNQRRNDCGRFSSSWRTLERHQARTQRTRLRASNATVAADDAMGRDKEVERRCPHRQGDATMCQRASGGACEIAIRHEFTERKRSDELPNR